jgi:hypothetical protein
MKGSMLILHYLKLPGGLLQEDDQMDSVIHRPKNKVMYPRAKSLETWAPIFSLLEPGKHLSHNTYLGNINGQAPQYELGGQRHCCPERR